MARIIALMALTALGLSGAPVHEPVHARGPSCQVIPLLSVTSLKAPTVGRDLGLLELADMTVGAAIGSVGGLATRLRPGADGRPLRRAGCLANPELGGIHMPRHVLRRDLIRDPRHADRRMYP